MLKMTEESEAKENRQFQAGLKGFVLLEGPVPSRYIKGGARFRILPPMRRRPKSGKEEAGGSLPSDLTAAAGKVSCSFASRFDRRVDACRTDRLHRISDCLAGNTRPMPLE